MDHAERRIKVGRVEECGEEKGGKRRRNVALSSFRGNSNARDISTNRITPPAPPFIIILLVFPLLHPHWMTFFGALSFREKKKNIKSPPLSSFFALYTGPSAAETTTFCTYPHRIIRRFLLRDHLFPGLLDFS